MYCMYEPQKTIPKMNRDIYRKLGSFLESVRHIRTVDLSGGKSLSSHRIPK